MHLNNQKLNEILNQDCLFKTNQLSILHYTFIETKTGLHNSLSKSVLKIMTPNVTKSLPDGWQNLNTLKKAEKWLLERKMDSNFYIISLTEPNELIGFLFLYTENERKGSIELRLGYLLSESIWGKGIGSELIKGLVTWCDDTKSISSISGGVEKDNIGSRKVLEKNGFYKSNEKLPDGILLYKIDFELEN